MIGPGRNGGMDWPHEVASSPISHRYRGVLGAKRGRLRTAYRSRFCSGLGSVTACCCTPVLCLTAPESMAGWGQGVTLRAGERFLYTSGSTINHHRHFTTGANGGNEAKRSRRHQQPRAKASESTSQFADEAVSPRPPANPPAPPTGRGCSNAFPAVEPSQARPVWLLGRRCVELSLPDGLVRCHILPRDVKPGSRAVDDPSVPGGLFVLENGSSKLWRLRIAEDPCVEDLAVDAEASRFRSSLGSRMLVCGATGAYLLVTGTPGVGAHTPWLFDLRSGSWAKLPDAPHPILSSATMATGDTVAIVGGWSKQRSCHGHIQVLNLRYPYSWTVMAVPPVPWRRPGAGCEVEGRLLVAMGWMECLGEIGSPDFRLLKRDGAKQQAPTSSSKLLLFSEGGAEVSELSVLPFADSFEHSGQIYVMDHACVCIGRDHVQMYDMPDASWQTWPLPREIGNDSSNSWVKHCGSWALAWLT